MNPTPSVCLLLFLDCIVFLYLSSLFSILSIFYGCLPLSIKKKCIWNEIEKNTYTHTLLEKIKKRCTREMHFSQSDSLPLFWVKMPRHLMLWCNRKIEWHYPYILIGNGWIKVRYFRKGEHTNIWTSRCASQETTAQT